MVTVAAKSAEERAVVHAEATAALVKGIVPSHSVSPSPLYVEVGTISGLELYRRVETAPKEAEETVLCRRAQSEG